VPLLPSPSPSGSIALASVLLVLLTLEVVASDDVASVPSLLPVCCICNSSDCSSAANCWKADEKSLLLALVVLLLLVELELDALEVEVRKDVVLVDDALEVEDADLYQST